MVCIVLLCFVTHSSTQWRVPVKWYICIIGYQSLHLDVTLYGYVIDYAQGILQAALELNAKRGRVKASNGKPLGVPSAEDIMTVVRHDGRKVQRVEELLIMQKEIKIIQEMEKTDEESLAKLLVEN